MTWHANDSVCGGPLTTGSMPWMRIRTQAWPAILFREQGGRPRTAGHLAFADLVPFLETHAPVSEALKQRMQEDPSQHRFTLVFDRERRNSSALGRNVRISFAR